jgi:hypothetical protein
VYCWVESPRTASVSRAEHQGLFVALVGHSQDRVPRKYGSDDDLSEL